jgi:hypothetical protein
MPEFIPTGLACPDCLRDGKGEQMLYNAIGVAGSFCRAANHQFRDLAQLLAMRPPKIQIPQAPRQPNPGDVKISFQIPGKLNDALTLRFGPRLGSTVVFVLTALLEYGSFIVGEADALRMKEWLGEEVKNASHLVGLVYGLRQRLLQAESDLDRLQNLRGGTGKGLSVELPVEVLMAVADKAKFNNVAIEEMAAQIIETGIRNQWV